METRGSEVHGQPFIGDEKQSEGTVVIRYLTKQNKPNK